MGRRTRRFVLSGDALELVAARFRALGDTSRLRILNALMGGERSVTDLVVETELSQTCVSRNLGLLRREGLVGRRAEGNRALYRIVDPTVERLCGIVCAALTEHLEEELGALRGDSL